MATNDDSETDDETVLVVPYTNTNVYHTDPECVSVKKADKTRELPAEQVKQWFYSECGNCGRDWTTEANNADRSIYQAAKDA